MGGESSDEDLIEVEASSALDTAGPDGGLPHRLIIVGASAVAVGVGTVMVISGPMIAGWYVLVAATVALIWSSAQLLPRRFRAPAIVVLGGLSSLALLAWTPTLGAMGSQTWLGWIGLLCLAGLALPIAVLLGEASKRLLDERRVVALTITLVGVALAVLVAQPAALKIRFVAQQPEFDSVANRLLAGEDGSFDGVGRPTSVASVIDGNGVVDDEAPKLEPVPSVAGIPVAFGSVESDPPRVRFCLPGTVEWSCTNELLYAPGDDLDGDRAGWNVDCDLVTRRLSGDWYLRTMECPRT